MEETLLYTVNTKILTYFTSYSSFGLLLWAPTRMTVWYDARPHLSDTWIRRHMVFFKNLLEYFLVVLSVGGLTWYSNLIQCCSAVNINGSGFMNIKLSLSDWLPAAKMGF